MRGIEEHDTAPLRDEEGIGGVYGRTVLLEDMERAVAGRRDEENEVHDGVVGGT